MVRMYKPTIKATYKNSYAILYDIGTVLFNKVQYKWLLIATLDGVAYDTILLPNSKYKQDERMFTICHADEDEVFYIA